ncbi:DNA cytosine methyltransferase [Streptomyces albidoflavus]|uniref:DNA cytosine methyltransferase n=1 Tax=Streptomyces albidoflavus TaxID=1886 RepID=UPI00201BCCFB|nr:DNA cytosine methyltransferase [Streptomyces albidoflavus]MCL6281656.1 DNA cytosine methyltransferase [Streptomyces albidoflavus]WSI90670.1 DNA cytosine methyltransferase [Streptomyces albidoflavus]
MITNRLRVLDLFCCQGGAAMGYHRAGFNVTGIDLAPQPRYPFHFIQADSIDYVREHGAQFDFIHASPPCQRYSRTQKIQHRDHPDLIAPTRTALEATGRPWVIENVEEAHRELRNPVTLCAAAFGMRTYRHRLFETGGNFTFTPPRHPAHWAPLTKMGRPRAAGHFAHYVGNFSGVQEARTDMGVPWMNRDGIRECIPPAYTHHIATALLTSRLEVAA